MGKTTDKKDDLLHCLVRAKIPGSGKDIEGKVIGVDGKKCTVKAQKGSRPVTCFVKTVKVLEPPKHEIGGRVGWSSCFD